MVNPFGFVTGIISRADTCKKLNEFLSFAALRFISLHTAGKGLLFRLRQRMNNE